MSKNEYVVFDDDGLEKLTSIPGVFGGHRLTKIFGRFDCPQALKAIRRGGYVRHRVFFKSAEAAAAAGYRPCASCLGESYLEWRVRQCLPATQADGRELSANGDHPVIGASRYPS
jgi:hypothetical protein